MLSVSVYYVAVRTIVLSRHGSNLARPVIIHDIIHGLIYVPSTPYCGFFGVSPDGNCAYVHWGSFTSNSKSVRRAIWFTWFSEPHECIQHLAVPGGHPSNYEPGATSLNFSDRADIDERTPYSMLWVYGHYKYVNSYSAGIDFRRQNLTSPHCKGQVSSHCVCLCTETSDKLGTRVKLSGWVSEWMNIALVRFLHNHGNILTEGSQKSGLCPTLI